MNSEILVSIIIPAYNASKYIVETVEAALNQTHKNIEVLVVNDGSKDNTAEVVKQLETTDSRLKLIDQKNGGVSSARNHGFKLSKGAFLAFLDADDVWLPKNIELKLQKFASDPEFGLVHSDMAIIDENSKLTGETKSGKEGWILNDLLSWNGTCVPTPSSILVKREVLEKVGLFDLELSNAADQEIFFRIAKFYKIGRVPLVTWHYRVHGNNMHSNIPVMEKDALIAYKRADENNLFHSKSFRNQCYSTMYRILGMSWWKDGKNKSKGFQYLWKSFVIYPSSISYYFKRLLGK